ncbi:MAG: hypothetical protein HY228_00950 [Candidatus Yonathbacteria bacterium]|nr:hypothetical protein [Candidatus Yonathbacteria bacterium]
MLEKLRSKPDHIKKIISFILTTVIFSVIVFVWVSSWDARSQSDSSREKTISPLSSFVNMGQGIISDVKDKISSMPSYTENINPFASSTPLKETDLASSTSDFNISGMVIIDPTTNSANTPSLNLKN